MEKNNKNIKGITLIALIITIVVMLILVVVTIQIALNTGLFETAGKTTKDWKEEQEREQEEIAGIDVEGIANSYVNGGVSLRHEVIQNGPYAIIKLYPEIQGVETQGNNSGEDNLYLGETSEASNYLTTCSTVNFENEEQGIVIAGEVQEPSVSDAYIIKMGEAILAETTLSEDEYIEVPATASGEYEFTLEVEDGRTASKTANVTIESSESVFVTDGNGILLGLKDEYMYPEDEISCMPESKFEVIVVPEKIGDETITTIGQEAFGSYSTIIKAVYLPDTIQVIDTEAFKNCLGLQEFNIPQNVTLIGRQAFDGCELLTSIYIPSSVTEIKNYAFSNCSNLTINCEVASQPVGWDDNWNSSNRQVNWGVTNE